MNRATFAGMYDYIVSTYGDHIAPVYDEWTSEMDPSDAVELLASLVAAGERVLELGIGTGRIALPLAARGIQVEGFDASRAMVDRLRAKEGGADIKVSVGDFADVAVDGMFGLVFAAFSTFFALPSQQEQLRCLVNVVAHLQPGAHLVLEAFVPDLCRFRDHHAVTFREVLADGMRIDVARHDPVEQCIEATHLLLAPEGVRTYPAHLRYAWPAELDAMALASGLEPVERFGGYDRRPFSAESTLHVSLYRKPETVPHA